MPSAHGVTISGSLAAPGAFGEAIERFGRRSAAQQLRRGGENAIVFAKALAEAELKPSRVGARRRDKGVSYRNGFEASYTGLEEAAQGSMVVTMRNRSRHARIIEHGRRGVPIPVGSKGFLAWPAAPYNTTAGPWTFVRRSVTPSYFAGRKILERSVRNAIMEALSGRVIGHASIEIRAGRR